MIPQAWKVSRLRPMLCRLYSDAQVYRRLSDSSHRSLFASLSKEASRRQFDTGVLQLRPTISHFLVWLHQKKDGKLSSVSLPKDGLPSRFKESTVLETLMFHVLACLHSSPSDTDWLAKQKTHLQFLQGLFSGSPRKRPAYIVGERSFDVSREEVHAFSRAFRTPSALELSELQADVLEQALVCVSLACPSVSCLDTMLPWLRSLSAPTISQACSELSQLLQIPAFVTSDILLRTPMNSIDFDLQFDLWSLFMDDISKSYHSKSLASPVQTIIENLAVQAIHWKSSTLPILMDTAIGYYSSTRSGFKFNIFNYDFCNQLIYLVAFTFIRHGGPRHSIAPIIRAQAKIVAHITNEKLSQKGYMGIALIMSHESSEKAHKLYNTALGRFPTYALHCAITKVYLSSTVEELMHHFNSGVNHFPHVSSLWLVLIKKLIYFELLTERRSQNLLCEITKYSKKLIISKEIILDLISSVNTLHGIETFIKTLSQEQLLPQFRNLVLTKYMSLLYRFSDQPRIYKPFMDDIFPGESNLECARNLYHQISWKTPTTTGIMLNGEVNYQPEKIFELYLEATKKSGPNEAALNALLRASLKTQSGNALMWGNLYASQVAVHEFKLHVAENAEALDSTPGLILPSDKLWKSYIRCLTQADYIPELADIIRWWEALQFQPKKSTLLLLLRGLPREFVDRHIKHARAAGKSNDLLLAWPWPGTEEV